MTLQGGLAMTDTDTTAKARDTGTLIRQWQASTKRAEQIAADLAAKIAVGKLHRYEELPSQAVLADEYDVSVRTITRVKNLLAVHNFLTMEYRRYYIA
jgi:DNA-binding GntR family transcriptional regulator